MAYLVKKKIKHLKHIRPIWDYVKEFLALMLEIHTVSEEDLLFNFMDNLQGWAK